jgi:hypothetical protein
MIHSQIMTFCCDHNTQSDNAIPFSCNHNTQSDNDIQFGFREIALSQFDYYGYSLVMKAIIV